MTPHALTAAAGPVDPLLLLLAALLIDAVVGDLSHLFKIIPHPVRIIGLLIERLETKLNRDRRSQMDRALRGLILLLFMLALTTGFGSLVSEFTARVRHGWVLELILTTMLIAQRSLFDHVRAVGVALKTEGLAGGRRAVALIVGRDPEKLDQHGVARAAIESCAENFSDAVVAPVFWWLAFGFPGLLVYKTVNTLDSMIGHKSDRFRAFGVTSARLDDLMNLIPARLSGLLLALAALFVPTARPLRAFKIMLRDSHKHRSPNAGWPEGAMAGALGLSLSGPRFYPEGPVQEPWIGGELRARADHQDIRRALYLFAVACLLHAALIAGLWLWTLTH